MPLPPAFCWSKFGAEAGQPASSILLRKEAERRSDDGVFLWGIGTSMRPSLVGLLEAAPEPIVLFTPMRSRASIRDRSPRVVLRWLSARGLDGRPFTMPPNAVVTSGESARGNHYALVCGRDRSLLQGDGDELWLDDRMLRNLRSGTRVGASQVTSIVRVIDGHGVEIPRYRVSFQARLLPPYQIVLENPVQLNTSHVTLDNGLVYYRNPHDVGVHEASPALAYSTRRTAASLRRGER